MGAGTLTKMLEGFQVHYDPKLIVGYDKSDDASVYKLSDDLAVIHTTDFFPPIVDDPYTYGQIAATNALSDVYAMGGEPKLALNIMCIAEAMDDDAVHEVLRGGYEKAYEAGAIITGGHTIKGAEPIFGLAVTGFVHPDKVLTNSGVHPGDVLLLTKPLGVGIIMTAAKADVGLVSDATFDKICEQMKMLNKYARDIMVKYPVSSCTDVTGFSLMGHGYEMASGSGCTLHIMADKVPYHKEATELAEMGLVPEGAYRNRNYCEAHVAFKREIPLALSDIFFDPQTSGGMLIAVPESFGQALLEELKSVIPETELIGYITEAQDAAIVIE